MIEHARTICIGTIGTLGTVTLESVNVIVAILCGLATLTYMGIKIYKELHDK